FRQDAERSTQDACAPQATTAPTSLVTLDSTVILERHRFCSEDNDDEIRASRLSRAHRNQRKGARDNILGRTQARLMIEKERAHRCWRRCDHEVRAVYLRSLSRL